MRNPWLTVPWVLVIQLLLAGSAAQASPQRVAVLEYRAGASGLPQLGTRMARLLARLTGRQVVSPSDARRRFGAGLDAAVARCRGTAACIAKLGRRLGCDEVLLVGVSQLGDVIIAIQRIDTAGGRTLSRLADSRGPGQRVDRELLVGYLRRLLPPDAFKRYGRIIVRTEDIGARVYIGGELRGLTPIAPIRVVAPARYTVRVTRPGYQPFVARLDVPPEASVEVKPTLTRKGADRLRWYQRWWVWALVGGAVAAGATTAAVLATNRTPGSVDAVLVWTPPPTGR